MNDHDQRFGCCIVAVLMILIVLIIIGVIRYVEYEDRKGVPVEIINY